MQTSRFPLVAARASGAALLLSMLGCLGADANDAPNQELGTTRQAASTFYDTGFDTGPSYLPPKTVVLTFDDGPDWPDGDNDPITESDTSKVLDILKDENIKATFFINGNNEAALRTGEYGEDDALEEDMADLVRRIVAEEHELGSHTWHHWSLGHQGTHPYWDPANTPPEPYFIGRDLTEDEMEFELTRLEDTVDLIFGEGKIRLTLFRAPYGEPFQDRMGALDLAQGVVARHAVHVGWDADTKDYECMGATCSTDNIKTLLPSGSGKSAIILMHSTQPNESSQLRDTIKYLKDEGYQFWTTEQAVCAKFGKYSAELVDGASATECDQANPQPRPTPVVGVGDDSDGNPGDGDGSNGDGSVGDGSNGDGSVGDGSNGDGSIGDGNTGDGSIGDGNTGDGPSAVQNEEGGCSVGHAQPAAFQALWALACAAVLSRRRRARR